MRRIKFFRRIVLFLVRKKLRVKRNDEFYFNNQKNKKDRYYFTKDHIYHIDTKAGTIEPSSVSLTWLLDEACGITVENSGDWIAIFEDKFMEKCAKYISIK